MMQVLKQKYARGILRGWRKVAQKGVREEASTPIWQHRFYDFVVCTAKKRVEKLRYMHRNPVVRGAVLVNEAQNAEMRVRRIA